MPTLLSTDINCCLKGAVKDGGRKKISRSVKRKVGGGYLRRQELSTTSEGLSKLYVIQK